MICICRSPAASIARVTMRGRAPLPDGCTITALNDQHAYLQVAPEADLAVGDMIALRDLASLHDVRQVALPADRG